ncbi:TPR_REGION domain-containing protein [Tenacibaculum sp. 190130A14a]|uniref:tetratricopeptide repeat protein n=1 Tax=Tenacibaculum polynesiense TaxID=3137857 RepID=UPI0032B2C060
MSLFFVFCSIVIYAQDSIQIKSSVGEEKNIKFQQFFFKALSEKAKKEPQKAIEALDECNVLIPNNKAVLFELSKNYFSLNRTFEALEYANLALQQEIDNLWILEHIVAIHKRMNSFPEAIEIQEKIASLFPKKKRALVYLHLQNRDLPKAKQVLNELDEAKLLNARLRRIQEKLNDNSERETSTSKSNTSIAGNTSNVNLKTQFAKEKSFAILQSLLLQLYKNNDTDLLSFSEQGLALFPAQPLVYLMNGRALIINNQHKKAISSLQNGIDFVIDNPTMESDFYKELIKAYKKLGDQKNINKFQKKLKAL